MKKWETWLWLPWLLLLPMPVQAQSIQSAADGTGSTITQTGTQYTISGGSLSGDGSNLFHSFARFGLNNGELANFLSAPSIRNILGRVTSGEASIINGLIQVTGGNSNLYLMNPAGIVFGANASLNIPASFTATTATRIGFGTDQWFHAIAPNTYTTLNGTPSSFAFSLTQPGAIANLGNLAVNPGNDITLIGGTVVNTGTLTAPDGQITLVAVPGQQLVRLSQPGSLLSLEFVPFTSTDSLTVPTLPQLLTGGNLGSATGLTTNADGTVTLTQSGTPIATQPGSATVSGSLDVAGAIAGNVTVVGDRVDILSGTINASGTNGGGTIRVGGDYQGQATLPGSLSTTISQDSILRADALTTGNGGQIIAWSDEIAHIHGTLSARGGTNSGNGGFIETSGKQFLNLTSTPDASAPNGNGGTWLIDPTDITIVPGTGIVPPGNPAIFETSPVGNVIINTALDNGTDVIIRTSAPGLDAGNIVQQAGAPIQKTTPGTATLTLLADNDITLNGTINGSNPAGTSGINVVLNAPGNITTNNTINSGLGSISMTSANGAINTRGTTPSPIVLNTIESNGGPITLNAAGNITTDNVFSVSTTALRGGDISLISRGGAIDTRRTNSGGVPAVIYSGNGNITVSAAGNIEVGSFTSGSPTSDIGIGRGGDIAITSANGTINTVRAIPFDSTITSSGGKITLTANSGDIRFDGINSAPSSGPTIGGDVTLTSRTGAINAAPNIQNIRSGGGNIRLDANRDIVASTINSSVNNFNNGGAIAIATTNGSINVGNLNSSSRSPAGNNGGAVTLTAPNDIAVATINTQSIPSGTRQGGSGGNVNIQAGRFFRATGTFVDQTNAGASISTAGGSGGSITIEHGGRGNTPFIVGDAAVNGTAGAIASGSNTIAPFQSFPGSTTVGNIRIITTVPPLAPVVAPLAPVIAPPASILPVDQTLSCNLTDCVVEDDLKKPLLPLAEESSLNLKKESDARATLQQIQEATGIKPALIYLSFVPVGSFAVQGFETNERQFSNQIAQHLGKPTDGVPIAIAPSESDQLEVLLITATGKPIRKRVPVTRREILQVARQFREEVAAPFKTQTTSYLAPAQQLYRWIIEPLVTELQAQDIQNLNFIVETGLRFIPFAALHDGTGFLIEKYSLGLMPSLSLVDTRYVDVRNAQALLGGASTFADLSPLPAVPTELSIISQVWAPGTKAFKEDNFTPNQLKLARQERPFGIVHLATHGEFIPGDLSQSFIQFNDTRLGLDQLRSLGFNQPPVELIVLSACKMAFGSDEAELGFAGFALQSGAKSVLASLWSVSDDGTLVLMTKFYEALRQAPIKAEALRQAQQALINRKITVIDGKLTYTTADRTASFDLPENLQDLGTRNLAHPYYWAAFTLLGSPW